MIEWIKLTRAPVALSALSSSICVYLASGGPVIIVPIGLLFLISAFSVWSGMIWNDLADRVEDRQYRPTRPLVSGKISVKAAAGLASVLLSSCVLLALAGGKTFLTGVFVLQVCILAYNFGPRGGAWGPLLLILCRLINASLGALLVWGSEPSSSFIQPHFSLLVLYLVGLGMYMLFISLVARRETSSHSSAEAHTLSLLAGWILLWAMVSPLFRLGNNDPVLYFSWVRYLILLLPAGYLGLVLYKKWIMARTETLPLPALVGLLLSYIPVWDMWILLQSPQIPLSALFLPLGALYLASAFRKKINFS